MPALPADADAFAFTVAAFGITLGGVLLIAVGIADALAARRHRRRRCRHSDTLLLVIAGVVAAAMLAACIIAFMGAP